jgi:putative peptide zinc metalloprotease protein
MAPAKSARTSAQDIPRLADGIDLIGEYEGSGFKEPHYLARRADGQVVQLSWLLFLVAKAVNGERDCAGIAESVNLAFERQVSADNVCWLIDNKLRPLGVLASADGSSPDVTPLDPLLALRWRTGLVSERAVQRITTTFKPLFFPPIVVAAIAGLLALDWWLFLHHGLAEGARETLYQPLLFLMVFALVVVSAGFHEVGHATACAYGGAKPGKMGAGLYLVWPAFYTDVTDAYRLGRGGRLRTDLGGVYFNTLFCLVTAGVYFGTGFEPLLIVVFLQQLEIVHQMLPFLRLDGYYVVSDLTGVPDLFTRMKPILTSFIPGRPADKRVQELKPWVRFAVTAWVLLVIPILLVNLLLIAVNLPRLFATAFDSITTQAEHIGLSATGLVSLVQIIALGLPLLGVVFTFYRLGTRTARGAWRWSSGSPVRQTILVGFASAAVVLLVLAWWPDRSFRPYQPGEKGTLVADVRAELRPPQGRPALHARDVGGPTSDETTAPTDDQTTDPLVPAGVLDPTAQPTSGTSADPAVDPSSEPSLAPQDGAESPSPTPTDNVSPTASSTPFAEATP